MTEQATQPRQIKSLDDLPKIEIDGDNLTAGDIIDLEEAKTTRALLTWFADHSNLTMDDLRSLRFRELSALGAKIRGALEDVNEPGK
jgi:hypothetical protein